jgi:hypothetical protein
MGACEDDFFVVSVLQEPCPRAPACPSSPPPPPPVLPALTGTRYSSYYLPLCLLVLGRVETTVFEPVMWIRDGYNPDPKCIFFSCCGSGSREPNQCGNIRIRILFKLPSHKKFNFYMKNILKVGNSSKNIPTVALPELSVTLSFAQLICSREGLGRSKPATNP